MPSAYIVKRNYFFIVDKKKKKKENHHHPLSQKQTSLEFGHLIF